MYKRYLLLSLISAAMASNCDVGGYAFLEGKLCPCTREPLKCDYGTNKCYWEAGGPCEKNGEIQSCSRDQGICRIGQRVCKDGKWSACNGGVRPIKELCNGLDDDCDGEVDEDFRDEDWRAQGKGALGESCGEPNKCGIFGQWACSPRGTDTVCEPPVDITTLEICDGKDNDCDGKVDEEPLFDDAGLCEKQKGVCAGARAACVNGKYQPCSDAIYIDHASNQSRKAYNPIEEIVAEDSAFICDGEDNDCDGVIDEQENLIFEDDSLVINELVTCPVQAWNDTAQGNMTPFDAVPGPFLNGTENREEHAWLEIFNATNCPIKGAWLNIARNSTVQQEVGCKQIPAKGYCVVGGEFVGSNNGKANFAIQSSAGRKIIDSVESKGCQELQMGSDCHDEAQARIEDTFVVQRATIGMANEMLAEAEFIGQDSGLVISEVYLYKTGDPDRVESEKARFVEFLNNGNKVIDLGASQKTQLLVLRGMKDEANWKDDDIFHRFACYQPLPPGERFVVYESSKVPLSRTAVIGNGTYQQLAPTEAFMVQVAKPDLNGSVGRYKKLAELSTSEDLGGANTNQSFTPFLETIEVHCCAYCRKKHGNDNDECKYSGWNECFSNCSVSCQADPHHHPGFDEQAEGVCYSPER